MFGVKTGPSDTQQQMRRIAKPRMRPQRVKPAIERILFSSTPGPVSRVSTQCPPVCLSVCLSVHHAWVTGGQCVERLRFVY
ncbi:hypothetical protein DPMN_055559 [Dreissena polymorpha]|uniref:Uncharacterized protein n=1 Tax=Dreissena polymorpha TaxID=45954 RepID=A0A9D4CR03_DREPO|nr:hypothetical protein DPMN_055559 [Dreissena polymorpha]